MSAFSPSTPWRSIDDAATLADALIDLYDTRGQSHYDEVVTQSAHAAQTAQLAEAAGACDDTIVGALLHDVGHLLLREDTGADGFLTTDLHHEDVGARFLAMWFGPAVTDPIRQHVAAKRYLCAVDSTYHDQLSPSSTASLAVQGGAMTEPEAEAFVAEPGAQVAAELRRWDDLAKDPGRITPAVSRWRDLIESRVDLTLRGFVRGSSR